MSARREWSPVRDAMRHALEPAPCSRLELVRRLGASEAGVRRALRRLRDEGCARPIGRVKAAVPRRGRVAVLWGAEP